MNIRLYFICLNQDFTQTYILLFQTSFASKSDNTYECIWFFGFADLNADKKALLAFAALVPHSPKLKWDNDTTNENASYICTSWAGIVCTADNTRVLIVRLPAVGLYHLALVESLMH